MASDGRTASAVSAAPLQPARSRPLDEAVLTEHLGRLGGTAYRLESIDTSALEPGAFLTFPELHGLRLRLVAELESGAKRAEKPSSLASPSWSRSSSRRTTLAVCAGTPGSLKAALHAGAERVIADSAGLLRGERFSDWQKAVSETGAWLRLPPIVHRVGDDEEALALVRRLEPQGLVAGHLGQARRAGALGIRIAGDLFLNAYNLLTLEALQAAGVERAALSLEVDSREAARVASRAPEGLEVEVVVGGRVFSMLTRQDYGLEPGERFEATSEHGHGYVFEAQGGITTLYEARELVAPEALRDLLGAASSVRLDLAHQGEEAVAEITAAYRRAIDAPDVAEVLAGARSVHERWSPHGTFTGHLVRGARAQDNP